MKKNLLQLAFLTLPLFGFSQTYFSDDFNDEDVSDWTLYDQDGDGIQWADLFEIQDQAGNPVTPVSLISRSWQANVPLTPDNWIVSKPIDLTSATGQVSLYWKVQAAAAEWDMEHYTVYVATQSDLVSLEASAVKFSETYDDPADAGTQYSRSLDLSSFVGQTVYIAFRHHDVTDQDFISIDDVIVKAPDTVAPNCATLTSPANGATELNYVSQTLSWTAATSGASAESYDVYLDKNPDPTTLVTTVSGTSYTAANLDGSSTYYWKVVPKNTIGSATGCTVFSFSTMESTYCGPLAYTFTVEPITNVNFAGINNTTPASTTGGTAHEFFLEQVGNVTQGATHTITIKGNTGGNYTNNFMVFIDWNQDKDFADAGEALSVGSIVNSTGTDAKQLTFDVVVPADAVVGNTRMRVKKLFGTTNLANPCTGGSFGQAEDYTLNVGVLAVSETAKNTIRAYPNPVRDIYTIEAQGNIKSIKVFDVTGKQLLTKDINEAKSQIDFSKFNSGVYVVTTTMQDGSTSSAKVIKN